MKRAVCAIVLLALAAASLLLSPSCKKTPVGDPPATPAAPSGITNGGINASYDFFATTTDPDDDSVCFRFQWGDNSTSEWGDWVASGETAAMSHLWASPNTYQVKTQAKDRPGSTSDWSAGLAVTITTNQAPNTPAIPTGPASAPKDSACFFASITADPDGDGVSYRFSWGNGDTSEWGGWTQSGTPGGALYAYPRSGTFQVRAQARDANEALSSWSNPYQVSILNPSPPSTPSTPSGSSSGKPSVTYSFSSSAADPRGDSVAIRFAWGDGDTSNWSSLVPSGQSVTTSHTWADTGAYQVRAQARDEDNASSAWSDSHRIDIRNRAPSAPSAPSGPSEGSRNASYSFWSAATDPDGDSVAIRFAWGDGDTSVWSNLVPSGDAVMATHVWNDTGSYQVKAQAKDVEGSTSDWSSAKAVTITNLTWRYQTGGYVSSSPAVAADGTVYVGSVDYYLYAINPDGSLKWHYQTGDHVSSSPAVAADGTVYVGSDDGYLYAINPDGSLKWRYQQGWPGTYSSSPAVAADGTVYVGSANNHLYAINSTGTLKWRYQTGNDITSSPAVAADGTVYVGSWDNYLYALNPDGSLKWRYQTGNDITSSPAVAADGTVYVGSDDYYLYAINPTGSLKWRHHTGYFVSYSPAVAADGTVCVGVNAYLYAINSTGTLKWRYLTGGGVHSSPAVAADGTVYVGSDDHHLYAFDPSGTLKWRHRTGGGVGSSPAVAADGTIYVGSYDSYLYAIQGGSPLANSAWPKFHHDNRNTGRVGGGDR